VIAWRRRYARERLTGQMADRPRRGRPQTVRRARRAELLATTLARPPEHAIVVCMDEKSQIQALERTQPVRAIKPPPRAVHLLKRVLCVGRRFVVRAVGGSA
jgi:hypothetical protein